MANISYRIRRKTKQKRQIDEEITNVAEHLAKQRLFDISNEEYLFESEQTTPIRYPTYPEVMAASRSSQLYSVDKKTRDFKLASPIVERPSTRRVSIINYSHEMIPMSKSFEFRDRKGEVIFKGQVKPQVHWFEPAKNFTNFIVLDEREVKARPREALPIPKVNKSLYRSTLYRRPKLDKQEVYGDHRTFLELPRTYDVLSNIYRPNRQVIHSIYGRWQSNPHIDHGNKGLKLDI